MSDEPKTPRESGTANFWCTESEKLAVRLDALAIEMLSENRSDAAGEAHCLADRARALAIDVLDWRHIAPGEPKRVETMDQIISVHRRAHEMLSRVAP